MMWSLKLVIQRLLLSQRRNLLLVFQIFLGASILFSCLSIEDSCTQKTMEYGEGLPSQAITIFANTMTETEPLDIDDYAYLKESLLPYDYTPAYSVSAAIYVQTNGAEQRIPVLFVSDELQHILVNVQATEEDSWSAALLRVKLVDVWIYERKIMQDK